MKIGWHVWNPFTAGLMQHYPTLVKRSRCVFRPEEFGAGDSGLCTCFEGWHWGSYSKIRRAMPNQLSTVVLIAPDAFVHPVFPCEFVRILWTSGALILKMCWCKEHHLKHSPSRSSLFPVRARTRQWQAHRKPAIGLSQLFEPHSTVAHRWRGADRSASLRGDATWRCGIAVEGAGGDLVVVHLEGGDEKSDRSGRSHFMTAGNVHPQTCSDSVTSFMAFMASCSWGCSANLHCTESKALVPSGAAANFPHGPGWFRMNGFFEHIRCCVTKRWWELNFPSSRRMHFNCCHCKRSLVRHCFPSWNPVRVQIWSWSRCVVKGPTDQRVVSKCSKQNVGRPEFWLKLFLNQTSWDLPNLQRSHGYRVPFPVPLGLHESWKNVTRCQFFHSLQTKVTKDSRGKSWGSFFCAIFDCNVCACLEQHPHVAWHRGVHRPSHRGRHGCQSCYFHVFHGANADLTKTCLLGAWHSMSTRKTYWIPYLLLHCGRWNREVFCREHYERWAKW